MKKQACIFLAYYFPPMGASGVQRSLKFARYLPLYGWEPIVITPEPGAYHTYDTSLEHEMLQAGIRVERVTSKTLFHKIGQENSNAIQFQSDQLAEWGRWVSAFFWLPDNKKAWIDSAVERATELIEKEEIDLIVASAPPYSSLIAAAKLKERFPRLKIVFDFRDNWLESHLMKYPTSWHRNRMAQLEANTLAQADGLVALNAFMLESLTKRMKHRIPSACIPNGFDRSDFFDSSSVQESLPLVDGRLSFLYSGLFYGENQPWPFLDAIKRIVSTSDAWKNSLALCFQGNMTREMASSCDIMQSFVHIEYFGYLPHKQSVQQLKRADVLWMVIGHTRYNQQIVTGKLFEYMASGKPIFALVPPEGEAARLLQQYGPAYVADYHSPDEIDQQLKQVLCDAQQQTWKPVNTAFVESLERKQQAGDLASLLNKVIENPLI